LGRKAARKDRLGVSVRFALRFPGTTSTLLGRAMIPVFLASPRFRSMGRTGLFFPEISVFSGGGNREIWGAINRSHQRGGKWNQRVSNLQPIFHQAAQTSQRHSETGESPQTLQWSVGVQEKILLPAGTSNLGEPRHSAKSSSADQWPFRGPWMPAGLQPARVIGGRFNGRSSVPGLQLRSQCPGRPEN